MTTAVRTVERALNMLGAHSEVNAADPELFELGFEYLVDILRGLIVDEIDLGTTYVEPTALADDMLERDGAIKGITAILADTIAPICRIDVTPDVRRQMKIGKQELYQRFQTPTIPSMVPSRLLPRGAGSTRGGFPQTFWDGETLESDTNT